MKKTARTGAGTGALADRFQATFGAAPLGVRAAPGRVNLIGGHPDYIEGFVLPFAIDKRARTAVRLRDDSTVRLLSTVGDQRLVEADADPSHGQLFGTLYGWTLAMLAYQQQKRR